jgi:hypothetical protein
MKIKAKGEKTNRQKAMLGPPDLEHAKSAVLVSLRSPESQLSYRRSIDYFVRWLAAVRRLACEAADTGLLSPELAAGIRSVEGVEDTEISDFEKT